MYQASLTSSLRHSPSYSFMFMAVWQLSAAMKTIHASYWKTSSHAAINENHCCRFHRVSRPNNDVLRITLGLPEQREGQDEIYFEEVQRCGCDTIHICVVRDSSAHRSRRRLLYYERRSSSSWLRLSEHGGVPGGIQRHRRDMCEQPLVHGPRQRHGLSAKTSAFASQASS